MHAVVIANGEFEPAPALRELWERADLRLAADGGSRHARAYLGRPPDAVIGDLDSLDEVTRRWLEQNGAELVQHPVAKDETDVELALRLARVRGADKITLFGALGGRPDQSATNILLLSRWLDVTLQGPGVKMWAAERGTAIEGEAGDTVSLIPLDEKVEGIVTQNLAYPLRGETLERGTTRGVSNVLTTAQASVEWEKGLLLVVHLYARRESV